MQKKAENAFQFENSCQKRAKMEKRKHIYLDFFAFICKNKHAKKKHKIIFQKKMQKKSMWGVY